MLFRSISNSNGVKFTALDVQDWTGANYDLCHQIHKLANSFTSLESFCTALEMQDRIFSIMQDDNAKTKLILTGPISKSNVGYTMGNFMKIIESAKNEIILIGYVFNNIKGQMTPVMESLISATNRGVDIQIFFEKGNSAEELLKSWESSTKQKMPKLFYYKPKTKNSVLHAKAIIVDEQTIIITSANLTGSAMQKNIELGILHTGEIAKEAKKIVHEWIEHGYMVNQN